MRVLISGGGIAGSALAWWLQKFGTQITIVEKELSILPHGQNVDISGSARTVIKRMGLMDKVLDRNTTEKGSQFIDREGMPFAVVPCLTGNKANGIPSRSMNCDPFSVVLDRNTTEKGSQFIDQEGMPFALFPVRQGTTASLTNEWEILRGDLALLLYEATKDLKNVEYKLGTTVQKIVSNTNQSVTVEFSFGETQEFDLLVAADGQWSKLRKQCFPPETITVVDKDMYVGYWTIPRLPSDNDWWNVYHAVGSRIITLRPDPHGTIRAMFTRMPCNEMQRTAWRNASQSDRQAQENLLNKEFADAGWQAQRLLDAMGTAPDFYFHAIQQIKLSAWSNGRIICLGDAAFAPSPLTGMGTSLAITGAYVLAGELGKLDEGEHPRRALEAYEKLFRPFVEETQKIPSIFPGIVHPETAIKRWLLQVVVSLLAKLAAWPWLVQRFGQSNEDDFILPQY